MRGALATLDIDHAINEIASGTLSKNIAARYGVTPYAVRDYLNRHAPDRYKAAVADQAQSLVEDSLQEHEELPADALAIARARARADVRFKYAKAHNPAYQDHQHVTVEGAILVAQAHLGELGSVIDAVAASGGNYGGNSQVEDAQIIEESEG